MSLALAAVAARAPCFRRKASSDLRMNPADIPSLEGPNLIFLTPWDHYGHSFIRGLHLAARPNS